MLMSLFFNFKYLDLFFVFSEKFAFLAFQYVYTFIHKEDNENAIWLRKKKSVKINLISYKIKNSGSFFSSH